MTTAIYDADDTRVTLTPLARGRSRLDVSSATRHVPRPSIETAYPRELIDLAIRVKGPIWFADEIARDEDPTYVQRSQRKNIEAHLDRSELETARILDFGCGSGASTCVLARDFPKAEIVGTDINAPLLDLARARVGFYGLANVSFVQSPGGVDLPAGLGLFDVVMLDAVLEHMLPYEREALVPKLWALLRPGGVMLIHDTPYRWFPVEVHTTGGVPLINYLPDGLAEWVARRLAKADLAPNWPGLLRDGIRGASLTEIKRLLPGGKLLEPREAGDRVDLWYRHSTDGKPSKAKAAFYAVARTIKTLTGVEMLPSVAVACRKA